MKGKARHIVWIALVISIPAFAGQVRMFAGQVDGPVKGNPGIILETFRHVEYPESDWQETYYHECHFPDGTMITVSVGFNHKEASLIYVEGRPGGKAVSELYATAYKEAQFDTQGFGVSFGPNRLWLEGDKYHVDIQAGSTRARLDYEILGPSHGFGDGTVRLPDGKSFCQHTIPIPWARVQAEITREGKTTLLTGFGSMNRDDQVLSMFKLHPRWRAFWLYGPDHVLYIVDYNPQESFGEILVQRVLFADSSGNMYTSTSYPLEFSDWAQLNDTPFRYPRGYMLTTEAQGARLEAKMKYQELVVAADLYSNLPAVLAFIAKRLTPNGWSVDFWCTYEITYTAEGCTYHYQGKGIGRYVGLEEK